MKIQTVDAGVWWIAIADEIRPREGLTWQKLFETVQKEFKFAEVPTQLPQGNRGYEFKQGSLEDAEGTIVITLLAVYNDGINVAVPSDTRKAEKALQAAMDVFYSLGIREPVTPPLHYYVSTIVADFERPLDNLLPSSLLKSIATAMPVEGDAQLYTFRLNFDPSRIPGRLGPINPTNFLIERRVGVPYERNRYFSQANTTTEKHLELLEQIERSV